VNFRTVATKQIAVIEKIREKIAQKIEKNQQILQTTKLKKTKKC
jgi:hypothetical protein